MGESEAGRLEANALLEERARLVPRVTSLLQLLLPQGAPVADAELVERMLGVARVLEHVQDAPEIALRDGAG